MGMSNKHLYFQVWAVVVAQLVERLPPTPKVHGSNPHFYSEHLFTVNYLY